MARVTVPLQVIETKYVGATNNRQSRCIASSFGGSITVKWNSEHNEEINHEMAAQELMFKMNWKGKYAHGVLKSGHHVFVFYEND